MRLGQTRDEPRGRHQFCLLYWDLEQQQRPQPGKLSACRRRETPAGARRPPGQWVWVAAGSAVAWGECDGAGWGALEPGAAAPSPRFVGAEPAPGVPAMGREAE